MRSHQSIIQLPRILHQTIWQYQQRNASTIINRSIASSNPIAAISTNQLTYAHKSSYKLLATNYQQPHAYHHYHTQCAQLAFDGSRGCRDHHQHRIGQQIRPFWTSTCCRTTDKHNAEEIVPSLSQYQAYDMIHKLTDQERTALKNALNQYESDIAKSKFQGKLIEQYTYQQLRVFNEKFSLFIILL